MLISLTLYRETLIKTEKALATSELTPKSSVVWSCLSLPNLIFMQISHQVQSGCHGPCQSGVRFSLPVTSLLSLNYYHSSNNIMSASSPASIKWTKKLVLVSSEDDDDLPTISELTKLSSSLRRYFDFLVPFYGCSHSLSIFSKTPVKMERLLPNPFAEEDLPVSPKAASEANDDDDSPSLDVL